MMNFIEPKAELWVPENYSTESIEKHAEKCGRVCYNSMNRITDTSYRKFIDNIKSSGHGSVLEHATVYLTLHITPESTYSVYLIKNFFEKNPYSVVKETADPQGNGTYYLITTNLRVVNDMTKDIVVKPYITDTPTLHEKRITVHWTLSRAVADEFARHRALSHSMQSTRYVKMTVPEFVIPFWYDLADSNVREIYEESLISSYENYRKLLGLGMKAQQARDILPLCIKTELIQTGTISQWKEFLKLRSSKAGAHGQHPDADYLANKLYDLLKENKYI